MIGQALSTKWIRQDNSMNLLDTRFLLLNLCQN